jgi:hypothetical protein
METTHGPLHLRQMKSDTVKDHGHTYKFFLFDKGFTYNDGKKYWGYAGTNDTLNAEFYNFVQCHTFVNFFNFLLLNLKKNFCK